jgi:hypothetical protein
MAGWASIIFPAGFSSSVFTDGLAYAANQCLCSRLGALDKGSAISYTDHA